MSDGKGASKTQVKRPRSMVACEALPFLGGIEQFLRKGLRTYLQGINCNCDDGDGLWLVIVPSIQT